MNKNNTIKDVIKKMNETARKIIFIVDEQGKLLGTITDGDIRRWILKDGDLNKAATNIYNENPMFFHEDYDTEKVKLNMIEKKIEWIPILNKNLIIVDILLWEEVFGQNYIKKNLAINIPVVIMAGGKGTRLEPFTRILPKPLIPIGEKPIIEIIMDNFNKYYIKDFYITLNYKGEMIRSYFDHIKTEYNINYIWENHPLGTAGGLRLLPQIESDEFFLSNCDVIIKSEYDGIYDFHKNNDYCITIVASMQHFKIPYGVLNIKNGGELLNMQEKPEYDFLVNTGMYIINKKVINEIPENEYFDITDLIIKLKAKGMKVGVYPINQKSWLDIGQWEEYQNTLKEMNVVF